MRYVAIFRVDLEADNLEVAPVLAKALIATGLAPFELVSISEKDFRRPLPRKPHVHARPDEINAYREKSKATVMETARHFDISRAQVKRAKALKIRKKVTRK